MTALAPVRAAADRATAWGGALGSLGSLGSSVLRPLDLLRRLTLQLLRPLLRRAPALRRAWVWRDSRVPLLLSLHAVAAFAVALLVPSLSLALAPILLGVPHAASDVRHLVVRRQLPRWWLRAIVGFAAALILIRALEEARVLPSAAQRLEHALASAWLLVGVAGGAILGGWRRSAWLALLLVAAIGATALAAPGAFRLAFVQGHNLMAIAIWLLLFRRGLRRARLPVALVLVGAALLGSGALLGVTLHHGVLSLFGLHLFAAADWIAPGLSDVRAIALTTAFAFLQSVHYAIWLVAIPQDDDVRVKGRPSVRMAWRALARDFSPAGVAAIVALAALVIGAGVVTPLRTRSLFLSLATFHGWLELALLAFFLARDGLGSPRAARAVGPHTARAAA